MRTIKFQDISGAELTVQLDSGCGYRIYIRGDGFEPKKDNLGNDIPKCIHLTENQAQILISALQDLIDLNG